MRNDPLPDFSTASVDLRKLHDYCLNPLHPIGKHKARVFQERFNLSQHDAEWLRTFMLSQVPHAKAVRQETDVFEPAGMLTFPALEIDPRQ